MKMTVVMVLALICLAVQAQAMYVDASLTNTARADGSLDPWSAGTSINDGLWGMRVFGNNDDYLLGAPGNEIFEASGNTFNENCATIVTTASGLTAGQWYEVSVIYWSETNPTNQSWNVKAGFSQANMTLFDRNAINAGATAGVQGKRDGTSTRYEYAGLIGQIVADENGQIKVYVDDKPAGSSYSRSWYDGIQLTAIPEPATMLILGLGALLLGKRK